MKKSLYKACGLLIIVLLSAGLAACGRQSEAAHDYANSATEPNLAQNWTIEELDEIIVAAGTFWEDWWNLRGAFAAEHLDNTPWEKWYEQQNHSPDHPRLFGSVHILPSSGFESMSDVANHLLQFYTDEWVDREFFGKGTIPGDFDILFGDTWAFSEYNGTLYVNPNRWGSMRPNWATATHTLIKQDGSRSIVETTVTAYDHRGSGDEMPTATFNFTFIDGRIESGLGQWQWPESKQWGDSPEIEVQAEGTTFYVWHGPFQRQWRIFINSSEYINPNYFSNVHARPHAEIDNGAVIWADEEIYNVSVITFEPIFIAHEHVDEVQYRMVMHYPNITHVLLSGEALYIRGITGQGSYPNIGIAFATADNELHYFAIMHDHSESPYQFIMWDITAQMRFE